MCPRCTVFGLDKDEVRELINLGFKMTDHNKEDEGYEVRSSPFKVISALGSENNGFEIHGDSICTDAPGERKTLIYTLTKKV